MIECNVCVWDSPWAVGAVFAHAYVAPFDSLCVCQAKQCSTALIRLGKWLLHSSTATAVYIRKLFLWRGSDLKWIAKSTTKQTEASPPRPINAIRTRNPNGMIASTHWRCTQGAEHHIQGSEVINTSIGREFYIEAWGNITGFAEWSFMQTFRKSAKTSVTTDAENYKSYLQSFLPLTQWGACWSPCHPAAWSPRALGHWGLLCKHSLPLRKEKTEKNNISINEAA